MSGLVVRPGDTLFLAVTDAWPGSVQEIESDFETRMPGVTVKLTGHMGGPFVYRPDPPTLPTLPCCGFTDVHASFCSTRQATDDEQPAGLDVDCPCGVLDVTARPSTRFVGQGGWDITCNGCGNDLMYTLHLHSLRKRAGRIVTVRPT